MFEICGTRRNESEHMLSAIFGAHRFFLIRFSKKDRKIKSGAIPVGRADTLESGVEHVPDCASWALCSCCLPPPWKMNAIGASLERDYRSITEQSIPNTDTKQALAATQAAPRHSAQHRL